MFGTRDLSVRAERVSLRGANSPTWKTVLHSEGDTDAWRIIEASSANGRPFELRVSWSAANGSGAHAVISVAHATRLCVFGRTVHVRAKNLDRIGNEVGVTIADGYAETRNQYELVGHGFVDETSELDENPLKVQIPPFARRFTVHTTAPDATGHVCTIDGSGRRRSRLPLSKQPAQGVPVGAARELELWLGPYDYRIVFDLEV